MEHLLYSEEQALSSPLLIDLMCGVLARHLPFRFRAGGFSMFPFIRDGDIISILKIPRNGPAVGEVVAFRVRDGNQLTVHRVVRKTRDSCILKGDNYPFGQSDGPIAAEDLLGVVFSIERKGHKIRFGLGPERSLIALLSRLGWLRPMVRFFSAFNHRIWIPRLKQRR